jgi:secreted trypsin-like serine protease
MTITLQLGACGASHSRPTGIVGGTPVISNQLPWMAYISDMRGGFRGACSGTVLAPRVVLTAAHCVEAVGTGARHPANGFLVVTGDVGSFGRRFTSEVSRTVLYPGYTRAPLDGDAALMILASPTAAPPIRLLRGAEAKSASVATVARVAGWGKTMFRQGEPVTGLKAGRTVVQSASWCALHAREYDAETEICAIDSPYYATAACDGSSGGPLFAQVSRARPVIEIAVISYGDPSCAPTRPTVFTRASAISAWAEGIVREVGGQRRSARLTSARSTGGRSRAKASR